MEKLNGLDLFSGIGGIGIGLEEWVRTACYCEQDRYAQGVLLSRMQSGDIDRAPIWDDVQTLKGTLLPKIDIIFGGFPCQDISVAGNGKGLEGKRSGLFFEIARLASELRPKFIFLENVTAITVRGLERITMELTALGYDCRWTVVSAAEVGANHLRERWFLLAYANSNGDQRSERRGDGIPKTMAGIEWQEDGSSGKFGGASIGFGGEAMFGYVEADAISNADGESERDETSEFSSNGDKEPLAYAVGARSFSGAQSRIYNGKNESRSRDDESKRRSIGKSSEVSDSESERIQRYGAGGEQESHSYEGKRISMRSRQRFNPTEWKVEPDFCRVVDGLSFRVDRIKCLGNGVVYEAVKKAFKKLIGLSYDT